MRSRQLGASDLQMSEISLGSSLTDGGGGGDGVARACGSSMAQLALAWMLREENVASGIELDTETRARIDAILA
jgi:aryl-alcohol dehydrogenase-like predicted oxidoreductase